jgi:putative transposase
MKKSRFTEQQIAYALRQAETGTKVKEVVRKLGITEQTFYRWKRKYGGLGPSELRKLRLLEEENRKLKQMVADLSLDKAMLQEVIEKNSEGRASAPVGGIPAGELRGQRTSCLSRAAVGTHEFSLPIRAEGSDRLAATDPGARRSSRSLWLPANPHPASTRGFQGEQAPRSSSLSRGRAEPAAEATSSPRLSHTSCGATAAERTKRELVDGLRLGQLVRRPEIPGVDVGREL